MLAILQRFFDGIRQNPAIPLGALTAAVALFIVAAGRPKNVQLGPVTFPFEKVTPRERIIIAVLGLPLLAFGLLYPYFTYVPPVPVCASHCAPPQVPSTWVLRMNDTLLNNDAGNKWDIDGDPDEPKSTRFFASDGYHLSAPATENIEGLANKSDDVFTDFYFQASMTILAGTQDADGGVGLIIRSDDTGSDYVYSFDALGNCTFELFQSKTQKVLDLLDCSSPYFKTGEGQTNVLGVMAVGDTFTLYVNDRLVIPSQVQNRFISGGQLGFEVDAGDTKDAAAVYTNARVWAPPTAPGG